MASIDVLRRIYYLWLNTINQSSFKRFSTSMMHLLLAFKVFGLVSNAQHVIAPYIVTLTANIALP